MISSNARLTIKHIPLDCIQVKEFQERYPEKLATYIHLLKKHPGEYAGLLFVVPSDTHADMFALLDGHHKFCASIMCGRADALCLVVEESVQVRKAQEVTETISIECDEYWPDYTCPFCKNSQSHAPDRDEPFLHKSTCIVTKARVLMGRHKAQPQIEVKIVKKDGK